MVTAGSFELRGHSGVSRKLEAPRPQRDKGPKGGAPRACSAPGALLGLRGPPKTRMGFLRDALKRVCVVLCFCVCYKPLPKRWPAVMVRRGSRRLLGLCVQSGAVGVQTGAQTETRFGTHKVAEAPPMVGGRTRDRLGHRPRAGGQEGKSTKCTAKED